MKIAVITPVYNGQDHIVECIKSVRAQKLPENVTVKHYVFNDGSTDNTGVVLAKQNPAILLSSEVNLGVSAARNSLIERALADKCDYVAFLDADDTWCDNHLSVCLSNSGEHDIAYTSCRHVFEDKTECIPQNMPIPKMFIGKQLMRGNFIFTPCVLAKASCFANNQFDPELNGLEDWDMWYRLWEQGFSFVAVDQVTVTHTVRKSSMAQTGQAKMDAFKSKHKTLDSIKLHLACGTEYHDDYINVDLYADAKVDAKFDVKKLPYEDNSVDEIKAFHIIEHFDWHEGNRVLQEWARVLKPGGRLYLDTPDFYESCKQFVKVFEGNDEDGVLKMYGHIFSEAWSPGQAHLFLFTEPQLRTQLEWAGFGDIKRMPPTSRYLQWHPPQVFLCMEAYKK